MRMGNQEENQEGQKVKQTEAQRENRKARCGNTTVSGFRSLLRS